jgi:hypothetical protein
MLSKIKALKGYKLACRDGEIGKAREFYFDDQHWTVRYLVADTGSWLTGRQVLISPYALVDIDKEGHSIDVDLTKEQIKNSPQLDSDKPVSRQFEDSYYGYYGWPSYWSGPYSWGYSPNIERNRDKWGHLAKGEKSWDPHLRSTLAVTGYDIEATDGDIGHVEDFIIDDATWAIRYLVVATKNWWPGKKVLISPQWIERISWPKSKVFINLSREFIKSSPEFTDESLLNRHYESTLYGHYNRQGYWVEDLVVAETSA